MSKGEGYCDDEEGMEGICISRGDASEGGQDGVKWHWGGVMNRIPVSFDRWKIKTKLNTIYIKTLGFGKPEGNPVKSRRL